MDEPEIMSFLERYGQAISTGDLKSVVQCWTVPALVLSDQGAIAVSDLAEVERFFSQAVQAYHAQGLMSTRPDFQRFEQLSETLTAVDVRWPSFDASGAEKSSELSHYILTRGDDHQLHIRVALTRTA
jgi:hypothetical protein